MLESNIYTAMPVVQAYLVPDGRGLALIDVVSRDYIADIKAVAIRELEARLSRYLREVRASDARRAA
jgi:hypothetical protein